MKKILVIILMAATTGMQAQYFDSLTVNNFVVGVSANGALFQRTNALEWLNLPTDTVPLGFRDSFPYEFGKSYYPKNSSIPQSTFFSGFTWFSGFDDSNEAFVAAQMYRQFGGTYAHGPVAQDYNDLYDSAYARVWKISRQDIDAHIVYQAANNAVNDPKIAYWPAYRNDRGSFRSFVDVDNDNEYTPANGDYPKIYGDEAIYVIFNAERDSNRGYANRPPGLEYHMMLFAYTPKPGMEFLDRVVFVKYAIINQSDRNYHNTSIGTFSDPDLGCFDNDYIGCDTGRSVQYVYQATQIDTHCGRSYGYPDRNIAAGSIFLNNQMDYFGMYNNDFSGQGNPDSSVEIINYMNGRWKDSTIWEWGGDAYLENSFAFPYMFYGDPNNPTQWSERYPLPSSTPNVPADRRMIAFTKGIDTFQSDECVCLDMAYFIADDFDTSVPDGNFLIVNDLLLLADSVRDFYNDSASGCWLCSGNTYKNDFLTSLKSEPISNASIDFQLFPNPAQDQLYVSSTSPLAEVRLIDIRGKEVTVKNSPKDRQPIDIHELSNGSYFVQIRTKQGSSAIKKLIIAR